MAVYIFTTSEWIMCLVFSHQGWNSDDDDGSYCDSSMRKRAVKVKHVKRREKRSEKKVKIYKHHKHLNHSFIVLKRTRFVRKRRISPGSTNPNRSTGTG